MSKYKQREQTFFVLYQTLLKGYLDKEDYENLPKEFRYVLAIIFDQKDELIELINDQLNQWTFDRLGYIEQAILLLACGEVIALQTPKQVVINESVEYAKKYGEEDTTYKLINATLDKVLDV